MRTTPLLCSWLGWLQLNRSHLQIPAIATKNSCILLGSPSTDIFLPPQIEYIVQFASKNDITTLVAVQQFKQHDTWSDPFSSYPLLQTQMWSPELGTIELHPVNNILCHFASSTMLWEGERVMVVVSLSCVWFYFISYINLNLSFQRNFKLLTLWPADFHSRQAKEQPSSMQIYALSANNSCFTISYAPITWSDNQIMKTFLFERIYLDQIFL